MASSLKESAYGAKMIAMLLLGMKIVGSVLTTITMLVTGAKEYLQLCCDSPSLEKIKTPMVFSCRNGDNMQPLLSEYHKLASQCS